MCHQLSPVGCLSSRYEIASARVPKYLALDLLHERIRRHADATKFRSPSPMMYRQCCRHFVSDIHYVRCHPPPHLVCHALLRESVQHLTLFDWTYQSYFESRWELACKYCRARSDKVESMEAKLTHLWREQRDVSEVLEALKVFTSAQDGLALQYAVKIRRMKASLLLVSDTGGSFQCCSWLHVVAPLSLYSDIMQQS